MNNPDLAQKLMRMKKEDLDTRAKLVENGELFNTKETYHPLMKQIHEKNNVRIQEIINEYGWPGFALVGVEGSEAAWLIIQHAILAPKLQQQALKLLRDAVKHNDAEAMHLAYLEDRLLMNAGEPQIYGTQHVLDKATNQLVPYSIINSESVDERREAIGLEPLKDKTRSLNVERRACK